MSNERREDEIKEKAPAVAKKPRRFFWLGAGIICSTVSVVVLIIVGAYGYASLMTAHMQLATIAAESKNQLHQLQSDFQTVQSKVDSTEQLVQQREEDVKNLKQAVSELSQHKHGNQEEWLIAEARYYVRLANEQLQFSHAIPQAIVLLSMADQVTGHATDPKLTELHKAIAVDITNLKKAPQVNTESLYKKLIALDGQLDKLTLLVNQPDKQEQKSATIADQKQAWWQHGLRTSWQALQSIVVVRYHPSGAMPPVTLEQQAFLYQNLHAMLAQTVWALLNKQTAIYQSSLQQATEWIKCYFAVDSATARAVLDDLTQLQKTEIDPAVPTLTATLQAFNGV